MENDISDWQSNNDDYLKNLYISFQHFFLIFLKLYHELYQFVLLPCQINILKVMLLIRITKSNSIKQ